MSAILLNIFSLFPAYAGMILKRCYKWEGLRTIPRVCGDDPQFSNAPYCHHELFPAYAGMILLFPLQRF